VAYSESVRVFVGWSGEQSKTTAKAICTWGRMILRDVAFWMSEDIEKGAGWWWLEEVRHHAAAVSFSSCGLKRGRNEVSF